MLEFWYANSESIEEQKYLVTSNINLYSTTQIYCQLEKSTKYYKQNYFIRNNLKDKFTVKFKSRENHYLRFHCSHHKSRFHYHRNYKHEKNKRPT